MSKIFNFYKGELDKVWYQSSNIKYSECIDNQDDYKTLKVVFNNGSQYVYKGVDVNQYLLFREDASQGKALNKYIKANGYEYERIEDADLNALEEELNFRMENGVYIHLSDNLSYVEDAHGNEIAAIDRRFSDETIDVIKQIFKDEERDVKII